MDHHEAAIGLARLAQMLRAEAANGLFWGGDDEEAARLRRLRRHAAALLAEVDPRPRPFIASVFEADEGLRTPMPGTELRIRCARGEKVVQRRRLHLGGPTLPRTLESLAAALHAPAPTRAVGIADTDLAGLPCPHTYLLVYEMETDLTAVEVRERLDPSDPDLAGPIPSLAPEASAVAAHRGPLPVSPAAAAILGEVAELGREGLAANENFYASERHARVVALSQDTVESPIAYPRIDCGDIAVDFLATGADTAIFDDRDRMLLIRRTDTGQWAMPGGGAEVGETVGVAAVREALEETGLDIALTGLVSAFDKRDSHYGDSRFPIIMSFAGRMKDSGQPLDLAELEASEARWIDRSEVEDIDFFRGHEVRVPAAFAAHHR
ncbi:hypothetical protein GCM10027447_29330 [Glycomyces halotolerans]